MLLSNSKQIYLKKKKKKQLRKQRKTNNTLKLQVKMTLRILKLQSNYEIN